MKKITIYEKELNAIMIGRKKTEEFILEFEEMIEQNLTEIGNKYKEKKPDLVLKMENSLLVVFEELKNTYWELEKMKKTEGLKYIYISFLRTSIESQKEIFRIDLYDEKGRAGEVECACYWECLELFSDFYKLRDKMKLFFQKQSKLKTYVLDERIIEVAESINSIAKPYIVEAIKNVNGVITWNVKELQIFIGEYLDKVEEVQTIHE